MSRTNEKFPLIIALVILTVITFSFGIVMMDYFAIRCNSFVCYVGAVIEGIIAAGVAGISFAVVLYVKVKPSSDAVSAEVEFIQPEQDDAEVYSGAEMVNRISVPVTMYEGVPDGGVRCSECGEVYFSPFDKAFIERAGKCYADFPDEYAAQLAMQYGLLARTCKKE